MRAHPFRASATRLIIVHKAPASRKSANRNCDIGTNRLARLRSAARTIHPAAVQGRLENERLGFWQLGCRESLSRHCLPVNTILLGARPIAELDRLLFHERPRLTANFCFPRSRIGRRCAALSIPWRDGEPCRQVLARSAHRTVIGALSEHRRTPFVTDRSGHRIYGLFGLAANMAHQRGTRTSAEVRHQ